MINYDLMTINYAKQITINFFCKFALSLIFKLT